MKFKCLILLFIAISINAIAERPIVNWATSAGGSNSDSGNSSTTDVLGNVIVTGTFTSSSIKFGNITLTNNNNSGPAMFVVKYDSVGNVVWAKNGGNNTSAYGISVATDLNANIYVCGFFNSSTITFGAITLTNPDPGLYGKIYLVKYDKSGNVLWVKTSSNTTLSNAMYALATDKSGNVYATGHFQDSSISFGNKTINNSSSPNQDVFLVKFDATGDALWAKSIGGNGHDVGLSVATDFNENVFVTGNFKSSKISLGNLEFKNSNSNSNIFLVKYDKSGNLLWGKSAGNDGQENAMSVATNKNGDAFICGSFASSAISFGNLQLSNSNTAYLKCYVTKYDVNGIELWTKTNTEAIDNNSFNNVCVDNEDNAYLTGSFRCSVIKFDTTALYTINTTNKDVFILKLNKSGDVVWARNFGGTSDDEITTGTLDSKNNLYITGGFSSSSLIFDSVKLSNQYVGTPNMYVAKIYQIQDPNPIIIKYCLNDSTISLTAPNGYTQYTWKAANGNFIGAGNPVVTHYPTVGSLINCEVTSTLGFKDTIYIDIAKYELNADFTAQITNCSTNSVQFSNSSTSSHSPVSYLWSFDDGTTSNVKNPTHSFTTPGSHKVTLSISNPLSSCNDTITKIIDTYSPMNVRIEGDSLCCQGFNITLKATGAETYLWSNGSTADSILVDENAGKVWLLGYYGNGICISDTVYKTIKNGSPPISISGHKTYCPGLTTVIKANGASKYEWSNGLVTDSIQVSSPGGNYWLLGQSKGGCYSDTLFFNVTEEPDWSFAISGNPYFCKNDSTEMFVHGGSSYLWSNSKTTSSVLIKYAGSYSVSAVNERGCQKTIDFDIIEHPLPDVEFSVSKNQVDNRNNRLSCHLQPVAGTVYDWDFGDGTLETGADVEHKYNVDNSLFEYTITLKATNSFGCQAMSRKSTDIVPYVPNVFSPNKDGINDRFMPNIQTQVFDRYGICLYNGTIGWDGTFKAKLAGQDTYFYFISYYDKYQQVHTLKGSVTLIR